MLSVRASSSARARGACTSILQHQKNRRRPPPPSVRCFADFQDEKTLDPAKTRNRLPSEKLPSREPIGTERRDSSGYLKERKYKEIYTAPPEEQHRIGGGSSSSTSPAPGEGRFEDDRPLHERSTIGGPTPVEDGGRWGPELNLKIADAFMRSGDGQEQKWRAEGFGGVGGTERHGDSKIQYQGSDAPKAEILDYTALEKSNAQYAGSFAAALAGWAVAAGLGFVLWRKKRRETDDLNERILEQEKLGRCVCGGIFSNDSRNFEKISLRVSILR